MDRACGGCRHWRTEDAFFHLFQGSVSFFSISATLATTSSGKKDMILLKTHELWECTRQCKVCSKRWQSVLLSHMDSGINRGGATFPFLINAICKNCTANSGAPTPLKKDVIETSDCVSSDPGSTHPWLTT